MVSQNPGSYTVAYSYPGETLPSGQAVPPESGTAQLTVEAAGSAQPGSPVYAFSIADAAGNSGYDGNGNILTYGDSVNGTWTLGYDGLNRMWAIEEGTVWSS